MSAILFSDRFDLPKRIVRPLREGEALPFYSTDELWRGVCHLVTAPPKAPELVAEPKLSPHYLRQKPELRALSQARPRRLGYCAAKSRASEERFAELETQVREDIKTLGLVKASVKHHFDYRTLKRLLGAKSE